MPAGTNTRMNREEWLAERRKSLGGSDAAAIMGLNPYATPYTVWADKTGRLPEQEDNEAMRQGRDLEEYVAQRFTEETGRKCRRKNRILRNLAYPFAHANVDRWIQGENAGLECKTTKSLNMKRFQGGEYPDTYYCQCVHYMAVTGADRWYLAVLVLGAGFYVFTIERDEKEIQALMDSEQLFWESYVERDAPPPVDGLEPTTEALNVIYKDTSEGQPILLFGREAMLQEYFRLKNLLNDLTRQKNCIEQQLKEDMGKMEQAKCANYTISWRQQVRSSLDVEALIKDHPDLDLSLYHKTTTFRTFKVKEMNEI